MPLRREGAFISGRKSGGFQKVAQRNRTEIAHEHHWQAFRLPAFAPGLLDQRLATLFDEQYSGPRLEPGLDCWTQPEVPHGRLNAASLVSHPEQAEEPHSNALSAQVAVEAVTIETDAPEAAHQRDLKALLHAEVHQGDCQSLARNADIARRPPAAEVVGRSDSLNKC